MHSYSVKDPLRRSSALPVPLPLQFTADVLEIVNFPIENKPVARVWVLHGLMTSGREVYDGKATMSKSHRVFSITGRHQPYAGIVWPPQCDMATVIFSKVGSTVPCSLIIRNLAMPHIRLPSILSTSAAKIVLHLDWRVGDRSFHSHRGRRPRGHAIQP